jgi:type I restriction enzyme S subunit
MGGLTKNKDKRASYPHEVPYLRVANVYANELRLDEIKNIQIKDREKNTKILDEGDLLIVEGNGSKDQIGRVAMWDGSIEPCSHQNHLIRVKILNKTLRKYVLYWLLSGRGRSHITEVASSTSGLYTLSLTKVRKIPVPLPPADEAQYIVEELEKRLTTQTQVAKTVENNSRRASTLRQAILKAAYQGNLIEAEDNMVSSDTGTNSNSSTGRGQQTLQEFTGGEMHE